MLIHFRTKTCTFSESGITVNSTVIERVDSSIVRRIVINSDLSWRDHVTYI